MPFFPTLITYLIVFNGIEVAFPSTNNSLVKSGENKVIYGDNGYPTLQVGHELEHIQAINQLKQIYSSALTEFLETSGSSDSAHTSSDVALSRLNIINFSRCAFAIPFHIGGNQVMVDILRRRLDQLNSIDEQVNATETETDSWIKNYVTSKIADSIEIFLSNITPADAILGLYAGEGWSLQYITECSLYNIK